VSDLINDFGPVAVGFGTLAGLLFVIRLALVYQRQVTQAIIEENERLRKLLAQRESDPGWKPHHPPPPPPTKDS